MTTAGCAGGDPPSQSLSPPAGPRELRAHTGGLSVCSGGGWRVALGQTEEEVSSGVGGRRPFR